MNILTFFNHAGGVGKTSSTRDVGKQLANFGFKILYIDTDPQANLTEWLGLSKPDLENTVYPAIIGEDKKLTLPTPINIFENIDIIPSHLDLAKVETQLVGELMGLLRLRDNLRNTNWDYDFVLIDPPPSLGQLAMSSIIAAEKIVVPLPTNSKGITALPTVLEMVKKCQKIAPELDIAFFVLTQYDSRTTHDNLALDNIRTRLANVAPVSEPLHYRPAPYKDAQLAKKSPTEQNPKVAEEVKGVTLGLLDALGIEVKHGK